MGFPRKYKELLETTLNDVEKPDYAWMVYMVCGLEKDSCGWGGWGLESVFKIRPEKDYPSGTGDEVLSADNGQKCPVCGRLMFRTEAMLKVVPAEVQSFDQLSEYEVVPMEYED